VKIPLRQYWTLLEKYLRPQARSVALLALLLLGGIVLRVLNPQIVRGFIDGAQRGDSVQQLTMAALVFLGAALIIQALGVVSTYIGENIGAPRTICARIWRCTLCAWICRFTTTKRPAR
jgi:ATP-binding cassette, subfamily B, bacterial